MHVGSSCNFLYVAEHVTEAFETYTRHLDTLAPGLDVSKDIEPLKFVAMIQEKYHTNARAHHNGVYAMAGSKQKPMPYVHGERRKKARRKV